MDVTNSCLCTAAAALGWTPQQQLLEAPVHIEM